jgi:hypothetical protein
VQLTLLPMLPNAPCTTAVSHGHHGVDVPMFTWVLNTTLMALMIAVA